MNSVLEPRPCAVASCRRLANRESAQRVRQRRRLQFDDMQAKVRGQDVLLLCCVLLNCQTLAQIAAQVTAAGFMIRVTLTLNPTLKSSPPQPCCSRRFVTETAATDISTGCFQPRKYSCDELHNVMPITFWLLQL